MKLSSLRPDMLDKAAALYCGLAYKTQGEIPPLPNFSAAKTLEKALALLQNESGRDMEQKLHRYTLRLGNSRYPFMKLVLQEVLIEGEYFLSVDTHDEMEIKPSFPDYAAWQELKAFNAKLKGEIEGRWEKEGLPTYASLQGLACDLIPENLEKATQRRILVVDDDKNIRETIAALLAARGYLVETAGDGEEALEKMGWARPDLVFLDYEMPGLDGISTIEKMRANEETCRIPVLLATAGQISMEKTTIANGFLVKPFQTRVMYSFIEHLLGASKKTGSL